MLHKLKNAALLVGLAALLKPADALAEFGLNLQEPFAPVAHTLYNLHNNVQNTVIVIGVLVFGFTWYLIAKFRKDKGAVASDNDEHLGLEIAWTVLPFVILIAIAIPATSALKQMHDTADADLTIKVTGYQWKWKYDYLDEGISFVSNLSTPKAQITGTEEKGEFYLLEVDNPIVVPVGKKIRFLTTANDVIHSFYLPALGIKKDAIPGFVNETWTLVEKAGTYRGQCAELCGKDHGFMPIVLEAKSQADYDKWVAGKKAAKVASATAATKQWSMADLMARGADVYGENCAMCHGDAGEGNTDLGAPALKDSPIAKGPVKDHVNLAMFGVDGTAMAAYNELLNDVDMAAVVTYERNAWGNDTGDAVQPSQIGTAR